MFSVFHGGTRIFMARTQQPQLSRLGVATHHLQVIPIVLIGLYIGNYRLKWVVMWLL